MVCIHCRKDTADRIIIRDDYGTVRASSLPIRPDNTVADQTYLDGVFNHLSDAGRDPSRGWECRPCRVDFLREDEIESHNDAWS